MYVNVSHDIFQDFIGSIRFLLIFYKFSGFHDFELMLEVIPLGVRIVGN